MTLLQAIEAIVVLINTKEMFLSMKMEITPDVHQT